jgi:hypothetical protein
MLGSAETSDVLRMDMFEVTLQPSSVDEPLKGCHVLSQYQSRRVQAAARGRALVSHRSRLPIVDIVQEVFELGECVGILVQPAVVLHSHPGL